MCAGPSFLSQYAALFSCSSSQWPAPEDRRVNRLVTLRKRCFPRTSMAAALQSLQHRSTCNILLFFEAIKYGTKYTHAGATNLRTRYASGQKIIRSRTDFQEESCIDRKIHLVTTAWSAQLHRWLSSASSRIVWPAHSSPVNNVVSKS